MPPHSKNRAPRPRLPPGAPIRRLYESDDLTGFIAAVLSKPVLYRSAWRTRRKPFCSKGLARGGRDVGVEAGEQVDSSAGCLAAGLHPRVRSGAAGVHYTSTGTLPMIPGIDAVGQRPDGKRIYFVAGDDALGTMADKAVADVRRAIELPDNVDVARVAAAMNPAMSSWVALRLRIPIQPGQSVLVLGVTGNAGAMAVEVAKRLGAGRVIGAGRDLDRLSAVATVGADDVVPLTADDEATGTALAAAAAEVDIVLDYLWGKPAQRAIVALLTARSDRSRALNWIQIGSVAGPAIELPSVALRSANLRVLGSGQGAVSGRAYLTELPSLAAEIDSGAITVTARPVPLADVEAAWTRTSPPGERTVLVP